MGRRHVRFVYNSRLAGSEISHIDLRSGSLSWSEHRALVNTAAATAHSAQQTAFMRRALEDLHYDIAGVANAIDRMEQSLVLRLEAQAVLLRTEVELLANIAEAMRTPRATRAAERITVAGALLEDSRCERALAAAEEAIEDDPNNRGGFIAAGWALLGLERPDEARKYFREATHCGKGDGRHCARRQAARLTFLLEGPDAAIKELQQDSESAASPRERAAADFDLVVYNAATGDSDEAIARLRAAANEGRAFCIMALTDRVASTDAGVARMAIDLLRELDALRAQVEMKCEAERHRLRSLLETLIEHQEQDEVPSDVLADLRSSLEELNRYVANMETWGFTALRESLDSSPTDGIIDIAAFGDSAERYVAEQRALLQAMRNTMVRERLVTLFPPKKSRGVWRVVCSKGRLGRKPEVNIVDEWLNVNTYVDQTMAAYFGILDFRLCDFPRQIDSALAEQRKTPPPRWPYLD